MNVIVHIDETNKWPTVLSNLSHLYEHWQQSHDDGIIELLVNGEAVTQVRQDADIDLTDLYRRGIDVAVCNNYSNDKYYQNKYKPRVVSYHLAL